MEDRHFVFDLDLHQRIAHGFPNVLRVRRRAAQNDAEADDG